MKKKPFLAVLITFFALMLVLPITAQGDGVILHDGVKLTPSQSNTQYNITKTINLNTVTVNKTSAFFTYPNYTLSVEGFKSGSPINAYIDLKYVTYDNITFDEFAPTGSTVYYNLSMNHPNAVYKIYKDGSYYTTTISSNESKISFKTTDHSTHEYEIKAGGYPQLITSVTPSPDSTSVSTSKNVKIVFNASMDTSVTPTITQSTGTSVSYTLKEWKTINTANDTAVFTHPKWGNEERVTLTVSDYQTANGTTDSDYTWTFTTESRTPSFAEIVSPFIPLVAVIVIVVVIIESIKKFEGDDL
ncbi:hypothetical protein AKJ51_05250 [candidate division MSBL1 archaeon SCGC-AAA382A20]|uniref:Uncharacterized protein n=1 Tax=candidate division MSBL1 archaeon SCGC-AAA382A20 TaxID=1698280 RepID=A0A133VFH7_9EURY|nr:hypothetical protein AKJ51_05250 [candidate division MSBL1 archaeon SCGC-AAA382A20]